MLDNVLKELSRCRLVIALVGQPNVGKSALFNRLTGKIARIGNFPGTTVEVKVGRLRGFEDVCIADLPGIYGISALTIEERIAKEFILKGYANAVVVLVDSTMISRTMYLALQIMEMTPNVIIALTKWDLARSRGIWVNVDKLREVLKVPIVPVSAITGEGINELIETMVSVAKGENVSRREPLVIDYGVIEKYIGLIERVLREKAETLTKKYPLRWFALRLLEGDEDLENELRSFGFGDVVELALRYRNEIRESMKREAFEIIADTRYNYIERLANLSVMRQERSRESLLRSLKPLLIESLRRAASALKSVLSLVLSFTVLFTAFLIGFIINLGFPLNLLLYSLGYSDLAEVVETYSLCSLVEMVFDYISNAVYPVVENVNEVLASLIVDGVIAGVGTVLSFLPLVLVIMLILAALEDSGIGPRIAIAVHNLFAKFGLSGRAIYPLLIALGCNVPAVMASRTAIDKLERLEIALTVSFVPCQARLVVLTAITTMLFPREPHLQALTILSVYVTGVLLYMLSSKIIRTIFIRDGEAPELLLEIPPLQRPHLRVVWWNAWELTKHFLKKAGSIIFALSIVSWYLLNFGPEGLTADIANSYGAALGRSVAPLFTTLFGIDSETAWKLGLAFLTGFIAKEVIISTLAILSELGVEEMISNLSVSQGIAILLFMMYYIPCLATAGVIYQETHSVKLTLFAIVYLFVVAVVVGFIAFNVLRLLMA